MNDGFDPAPDDAVSAKLLTTHKLDPVFVPVLSATIFAMAAMQDDSILVGGDFTTVDGQNRTRLLRLTSIEALDPNYMPLINDSVRVIIPQSDGSAYIDGDFTSVNGGTRNRVALLNASGNLERFDVNVDGPVFSMVESGRNLVIGGSFSNNVDGQPRARLARISSALGALDASFNPGANRIVLALATEPATNALPVGGNCLALPAFHEAPLHPAGLRTFFNADDRHHRLSRSALAQRCSGAAATRFGSSGAQ